MSERVMSGALASTVLLAAWLGAALVVAAVVAPAAFAVLPTRTLAGALVGRVLPVLFWSGIIIGALTTLVAWPTLGHRGWRTAAGIGFIGACAAAQLVVAPRIERIRSAIGGPVDALDPSDPRRQAFGRLHGFSVLWLGVAGISAIIVLVLLALTLTLTTRRST